ncbi:CRISPR-associated protein, Cse4 family [Desulfatibacillum aliphaticivorans]|uniref:CRISPR-associated protein, Cse4 family n=1 Tax=Desulfatibacillum aliphaticivorans TaxID=218208 RepID=B8FDH9_DESAL|nr:type I-E CRISPR-associated protein Cas7/Cse4/CasC [Desulfatibacillum aliphaticivorans]ACL06610.1 CRISPR-associated protein, Cse4 family [Desulfatibacillum aliphaticivorans]
MEKNPYQNLRVEFHILQSFPVTCLNRDDVGAPKTAVVGGATRARVSSQCWKRNIRLTMKDLGVPIGSRTKLIHQMIEDACAELGADTDQAQACAAQVASVFIKEKKGKKDDGDDSEGNGSDKSDALIFLSREEVKKIALALRENNFSTEFQEEKVNKKGDAKVEKIKLEKKIQNLLGKPDFSRDGVDIALFGRMVAQAAALNVEGAASFSHAISTHKVTNEVEFFTALDDLQTEPGSAHMGALEFNSATYYRYVCLDMGQLWKNLAGQHLPQALEGFVKALYLALPSARQATQSGACWWEFAKVFVRKGQRLQAPFDTAVKPRNGGLLEPSKDALCAYLEKKEQQAGSLFRKIAEFTFGEDNGPSIDDLVLSIQDAIQEVGHE